eukprot:21772-Rhodomonas_salina.2
MEDRWESETGLTNPLLSPSPPPASLSSCRSSPLAPSSFRRLSLLCGAGQDVEALLVSLILDKKIVARIDQVPPSTRS